MNLIIQGLEVATQDLKQLAKISNADFIEAINQQIFRLVNADELTTTEVATYCNNTKLDFGFIPEDRKLSDFGLVVMDMDSTLITIECIDEIADIAGLKTQVSAITESAMRGEIDFQESLRQRVKLLKGIPVSALEKVYVERLKLSPGAETFLVKLQSANVKTLLVSGGFTFFTEKLKARLNLDFAISNLLEVSNEKLTGDISGDIIDAEAKKSALINVREHLGLNTNQVIAVGDGANDLKMLAEAGISIAYHGKPVVQASANYAINYMGLDAALPLLDNASFA